MLFTTSGNPEHGPAAEMGDRDNQQMSGPIEYAVASTM
jgi:hypothetical protein